MSLKPGSAFICAMTSRGRSFALFKSRMTSEGRVSRMRGRIISGMRSKNTGAASALAAVEILIEKIKSSTRHNTILVNSRLPTPNTQGWGFGVDTIVVE